MFGFMRKLFTPKPKTWAVVRGFPTGPRVHAHDGSAALRLIGAHIGQKVYVSSRDQSEEGVYGYDALAEVVSRRGDGYTVRVIRLDARGSGNMTDVGETPGCVSSDLYEPNVREQLGMPIQAAQ